MRKMNWEEYLDGEFFVLCETEEEAKDFCKQRYEQNIVDIEWYDYWWHKYKGKTVFADYYYGSLGYFTKYHPDTPIYKWSEFEDCTVARVEEEPEPEIELLPYQWEISMRRES